MIRSLDSGLKKSTKYTRPMRETILNKRRRTGRFFRRIGQV